MFDLSPVKLLVISIVALVVLGPDKLPHVARQIGAAWSQLRSWRARLESEVRGSFPDLPNTDRLTEVVRSPLGFLDRLAQEHEEEQARAAAGDIGDIGAGGSGGAAGSDGIDRTGGTERTGENGPGGEAAVGSGAGQNGSSAPEGAVASAVGEAAPALPRVLAVPDDPSMN